MDAQGGLAVAFYPRSCRQFLISEPLTDKALCNK